MCKTNKGTQNETESKGKESDWREKKERREREKGGEMDRQTDRQTGQAN